MKKLIVFAAALLVSATAFAEGFGIVGGYTSSSMKMQEMTFKSSAGVHAGFAYNVPLGIGFSIPPRPTTKSRDSGSASACSPS